MTDPQFLIAFGSRLESARKKTYRSQKEASKVFNIANNTLTGYEKGSSAPDLMLIKKMCEEFNVTSDFLLGLSDSEPKETEIKEFLKTNYPLLNDEQINAVEILVKGFNDQMAANLDREKNKISGIEKKR